MTQQYESNSWIIDPEGTAPIPPGYEEVRTEREFLEHLVGNAEPRLFIRGHSLCEWATSVARLRRVDYRPASNPASTLRQLYPEMSESDVSIIVQMLGHDAFDEASWSDLHSLLNILDPSNQQLWAGYSGALHASQLLRWWVANPDSPMGAMVQSFGYTIAKTCSEPFLVRCYLTGSADEARYRLFEWMGILAAETPPWEHRYLPDGATESRPIFQQSNAVLRRLLIDGRTDQAIERLQHIREPRVSDSFAQDIARYLLDRPHLVDRHMVQILERYLLVELFDQIQLLVPHDDPGLPATATDLTTWYADRYRPWLLWSLAAKNNVERHQELGAEFAEVYLNFLQHLMLSGQRNALAWYRSALLRQDAGAVQGKIKTLLIVLDGVGPRDVTRFTNELSNVVPTLSNISNDHVLISPPTATPLTKPAIVAGRPIRDVVDKVGDFRGTQALHSVVKSWQEHDYVVWTFDEPDKKYHRTPQSSSYEEACFMADLEMSAIAKCVARSLQSLPDFLHLRVVVTSDHGRLMRNADRTSTAPIGLEPHGRCAWGKSSPDRVFHGPFEVEDELIWLNPNDFFLPQGMDYVVRRDHTAFTHSNDARGFEVLPHGGLFPEEVIVPWVELHTCVPEPTYLINVTGIGTGGQSGNLVVTIENQSPLQLILQHVVLGDSMVIELPSGVSSRFNALEKRSVELPVASWPHEQHISVRVLLRLPSGEVDHASLYAELETRSLYLQNDPLADLE